MEIYHFVWLESHAYRSEAWLADKLKDGFDMHHLDGDHENNDPKNLVLIECSDHMTLHGGGLCRITDKRHKESNLKLRDQVATLGKLAYDRRLDGAKWREVAKELELFHSKNHLYPNGARATLLAKSYAHHHSKPWPIF